jgi:cobalt-zinc-cadmium efflux system membrane fusion protein
MLGCLLVAVLPFACGEGHDASDHAGHDHDHGPARADVSVTLYEAGLELFMEYPAFVVGHDSPLVAHFTDTRDPDAFVWVTEGRVVATLRHADGTEEVFVADELLRNGIFKPVVRPSRAGAATLTLELTGSPAAGVVHVGEVLVHADVAAAAAGDEAEPTEPVVSYLKESQWKTVYATAPAERATLRPSVRATGELRAPSGRQADIVSPFAGRFVADEPLLPGQAVRAGLVLGRIVALAADPGSITADKARADADLALPSAPSACTRRSCPHASGTRPGRLWRQRGLASPRCRAASTHGVGEAGRGSRSPRRSTAVSPSSTSIRATSSRPGCPSCR